MTGYQQATFEMLGAEIQMVAESSERAGLE